MHNRNTFYQMIKPNIFFLLLAFVVIACKKNDDPQPNQPPSNFSVLAKQVTGTSDVVLTWSKAKDPDGDPVTYTVFWKDTLAKNLTDTTYLLKSTGYGTAINGTIVAADNKKATTTATFSFTTGANIYTSIPDANFEKALIELKIDDIQDGKVLTANAQKVTQLNVSSKSISSLQGIEAFTSLVNLSCRVNNQTSLNLSQNTALKSIDCASNKLISLDISKSVSLIDLDCSYNKITALDVSKNTLLTSLNCISNSLSSLDVSKNPGLTFETAR